MLTLSVIILYLLHTLVRKRLSKGAFLTNGHVSLTSVIGPDTEKLVPPVEHADNGRRGSFSNRSMDEVSGKTKSHATC